jgi:hypothetical protein
MIRPWFRFWDALHPTRRWFERSGRHGHAYLLQALAALIDTDGTK